MNKRLYQKTLAILQRRIRGATLSSADARKIAEEAWKLYEDYKGGIKWFLAALDDAASGAAFKNRSLQPLADHIGIDAKRFGKSPVVDALKPIVRGRKTPEMQEKVIKALITVLPKVAAQLD